MGPNGSGKSTLANTIFHSPKYIVTDGSISFEGEDITNEGTNVIAKKGIFMSFQTPEEIPGVSLAQFLKTTKHSITGEKPNLYEFTKNVENNMKELGMDYSYVNREFNVGFSGGEKKKNEILQMLLLNPKLAILDETDSGLDVDAIKIVSKGINLFKNEHNAVLIITHSTKILSSLKVDKVHILVDGKIIKSGDSSLAKKIEEEGYQEYIK
jgi:Fe-S cluster assembly ATP-binding protein